MQVTEAKKGQANKKPKSAISAKTVTPENVTELYIQKEEKQAPKQRKKPKQLEIEPRVKKTTETKNTILVPMRLKPSVLTDLDKLAALIHIRTNKKISRSIALEEAVKLLYNVYTTKESKEVAAKKQSKEKRTQAVSS